eukprot:CAMPEP_0206569188 /NCGR_PEP_ID=MMETSP0325_2-20121206/26288_1 /ASSEMBLY_ACC=CAM_ASM_000347 /TAXON_ID=2866 /ORGANISM="Crypthecodinium cohnii, Strain Seligo" /LENGTH=142 /DNA_ID=CAMNT_0054072727 /DNA_START=48 /DNA_END=472 /DNA_ORIENTATION=+
MMKLRGAAANLASGVRQDPAPAAPADGEGGGKPLDSQALQETVERTKRGAQRLFGNLNGWFQEAQTAVAEKLADIQHATEEGGVSLPRRMRRADVKPEKTDSTNEQSRRDLARQDAAQYFVTYRGLDLNTLPADYADAAQQR